MEKGLTYNNQNGHYYWQFIFANPQNNKRTRVHFVAKYKDNSGNIQYATNEAEAILAKAQYITNGGPIDKEQLKKGDITIYELIEMYKDYCISIGKKHKKIYSYCLYFLDFLAYYYCKGNIEKAKDILISDIEALDIVRYRRKRQQDDVMINSKEGKKSSGRKVQNSTIMREVNSVQGMFTYAKNILKKLKENPCSDIEPLPIQSPIKTPLNEEQETNILKNAKENDFTLYVMLLMFETFGNRKSEVYQLQWRNVNLNKTNLFKNGYVDFVKRKNGKSIRLPLSEYLRECLLSLPRLSEYVFTNPKTGTCYKDRKRIINRLLKQVGAKERGVGHHIFRHSAATFSESNGATASEVRDLLGQKDVNSLDTYLNQGAKRLQEIIDCNAERIRTNENKQKIIKIAQKMPKIKNRPKRYKIVKSLKTSVISNL